LASTASASATAHLIRSSNGDRRPDALNVVDVKSGSSSGGLIAIVVYEKLGLEVLRRAWINTDRLWASTFVAAAAVTLFSSP
jgi:hypothetical protein